MKKHKIMQKNYPFSKTWVFYLSFYLFKIVITQENKGVASYRTRAHADPKPGCYAQAKPNPNPRPNSNVKVCIENAKHGVIIYKTYIHTLAFHFLESDLIINETI